MKTPYYEIDERQLNRDIAELQRAMHTSWGANSIAACSVKTNSLPWLLNHFRENGFYAEVVSSEEYDLVMRLGFEPSHVIYNGPIKDRELFFKVLRDGGRVNLDSSQEIDWLEEMDAFESDSCSKQTSQNTCPAENRTGNIKNGHSDALRVGLRVNVDFHRLVPEEVPADAEGSRFGYCEENGELAEVIRRLKRLPDVRITGLHLHSSTKSRSVKAYAAVADFAGRIAKKYYLLEEIEYIDMGGGFYGGVPGKPTFDDYLPAIAEGMAADGGLKKYFNPNMTTLILEPGVSMVSSSFSFVTSVRDIKHIGEHVYVVIDGSRLDLNPQVTRRWYPHHMCYCERSGFASADSSQACLRKDPQSGKTIARQRNIEDPQDLRCAPREADADSRRILPSQEIVGATCMEYDRLFEVEKEPELRIGDQVVFDRAGGYTICLTPLFIHYFPTVYVKKEDGTVLTAREPWTNDEFLQKNRW